MSELLLLEQIVLQTIYVSNIYQTLSSLLRLLAEVEKLQLLQ